MTVVVSLAELDCAKDGAAIKAMAGTIVSNRLRIFIFLVAEFAGDGASWRDGYAGIGGFVAVRSRHREGGRRGPWC